MQLDNAIVGHYIAKYRKLREIKARDIAARLGMKEATYTKYERGETAITVDFMSKVAEILNVSPLRFLSASPEVFLESLNNPSATIKDQGPDQTVNEQYTSMMLKLMENIIEMNARITLLLERKE